jgi:hypothetical protein
MKQTKRFINLEYIVDVKNYKESFDKWMKIRAQNNASNQ